jgi:hypothetical protein
MMERNEIINYLMDNPEFRKYVAYATITVLIQKTPDIKERGALLLPFFDALFMASNDFRDILIPMLEPLVTAEKEAKK